MTLINDLEIMKEIIRSSRCIGVGANYIEANEALSKKDFTMRVKICRQEAKESRYWLRLIGVGGEEAERGMQSLINEATELMKIFGSIVEESAEKVLPVIATPTCRGKQSPFEIAELVPSVSEESRSEFASSFLKKDSQPLALLAKTMRFSAVSEKTK